MINCSNDFGKGLFFHNNKLLDSYATMFVGYLEGIWRNIRFLFNLNR
jgi:hypothetical protein